MKLLYYLFLIFATLINCNSDDEIREPKLVKDFNSTTGANVDLGKSYDVIIYGGTPAGITAAIEVANSNKSVLLISPEGTYLGGMITNGLGATDYTSSAIIGGTTKDFFKELKSFYSDDSNWFAGTKESFYKYNSYPEMMMWFEPKAAKFVFRKMIMENKIPVLHSERLSLTKGVIKDSQNSIKEIVMESGMKISGKVFIDASYEGDLMAKAGVSYTVGREPSGQYGESLAGIQRTRQNYSHQNPDGIIDDSYINYTMGHEGSGDKKLQAYCYRMTLTNVEQNKIDFPKPANYKEEDYALLFKYLEIYKVGKDPAFIDFTPMPNGKTDSNNSGPISTNFVGKNYNYPEATYLERERIIQEHKDYQMGLMWTLAYSDKVPANIREIYSRWGLPKDEFLTNGHWPNQLYIREGRRMIGEYVMTQANCEGVKIADKSVALGSYWMDSHTVQRYVNSKGFVKNEGSIAGRVSEPYKIDYGSLVPKKNECKNLLVPVCLSASHIGYSSIRMEPVYMTLGQVSGFAAVLAINNKTAVQDLSYADLKAILTSKNMVF